MASERDQEVNSVLKTADALARDRRRLDAIDMMTAANRTQRDPRLEQRLVSLRHNAFTDLVLSPGLAAWPPSPPDLFEGTSGLPEVCGRDLSAETLASGIIRHGCLLVRGLIPPHTVDGLKDDIDEVFAALDAHSLGAPVSDTTPWFSPFMPKPGYSIGTSRKWVTDGGGVWSVGDSVVRDVADGAPILRPVFGPGDALFFDNMFLHRTAADPAMTEPRYAIESWFFAPSRYPDDQVPLVF